MTPSPPDDLRSLSMLEIFRLEAENQTAILTGGLLELERDLTQHHLFEGLMRAAHSLKGAARIVDLAPAVWIAHAMEDCFVAAQQGRLRLRRAEVGLLLRGVDLLQNIGRQSEDDVATWAEEHRREIKRFLDSLAHVLGAPPTAEAASVKNDEGDTAQVGTRSFETDPPSLSPDAGEDLVEPIETASLLPSHTASPERVLRLSADSLNRLLGLAGESLVESRWLRPFSENLQRLKRLHGDLDAQFDRLQEALAGARLPARAEQPMRDIASHLRDCRQLLLERLNELEDFDRSSAHLSHRLYLEALRMRMRPFADGVRRLPRMVRDLATTLGKEVQLEILGEGTQVDRDILEQLGSPLLHLLRNAVDHGCEAPDVRRSLGKPLPATIRLEARHSAGVLLISVSDDGAGVSCERLRERIVEQRLAARDLVQKMNEPELLEFLFLPGFSLKDQVTEVSGRGVGLDVVQNMVKAVRGSVRVNSVPGRGTQFQLQLPLTLSVLRTLLVEIAGEPYAIPLGQIGRTLMLSRANIETVEGRQHFRLQNESIGLLAAHQIFGLPGLPDDAGDLAVVIIGDHAARYGLVVDRFLGERELVVQPLDPRLGKVQDISAAATLEDGTPVLIVDVEDLLRSSEKLIAAGNLQRVTQEALPAPAQQRKRVLTVDDSLTVRELERKLLLSHGYDADVAVDGMDGWNAVRAGHYDLVITDVDMPRMDGIELTRLIKQDSRLKSVPILIISYKDREEDRLRGLEAGADHYLTKGSFHDEKLLQAVQDLIGEPMP